MERQLERAEERGNSRRIRELERELEMPPFPVALAYLWRAYIRLRRRSQVGFNGPQPIGWQDIDAFIRRSGLRLAPWEVETIERIDDIFLEPATVPKQPEGQPQAVMASMDDPAAVRSVLRSKRRIVIRKGGITNG